MSFGSPSPRSPLVMALIFSPSLLSDRLRRGSGMNYRYDRADSETNFSSWTPRVAINYLITPRQGLRAVYSQAIRSPDMFENHVNWSYRVTKLRPTAYGQTSARYYNCDQRRALYFSAELMF